MTISRILPLFSPASITGLLGLYLLPGLMGATETALAGTRLVFHGTELDVSAACARMKFTVDSTLRDGITIEEDAVNTALPQSRHDGAENRLVLTLPNCTHNNRVSLNLAPGTTLILHDSPHADITITGTLSALESSLTDSTITLDHVQSLDLSLKGTSRAIIHQLDRAAQIMAPDAGNVMVDHAKLSVLSAKFGGSSQIMIKQGQIETLNMVMTDTAKAIISATSVIANIVSDGQSSVMIGPVSNTLNHTGSGTVSRITTSPPVPDKILAPAPPSVRADPSVPTKEIPKTPQSAPPSVTALPVPAKPEIIQVRLVKTSPVQTDGAAQGLLGPNTTAPIPAGQQTRHDKVQESDQRPSLPTGSP